MSRLELDGLTRRYGSVVALDDLPFLILTTFDLDQYVYAAALTWLVVLHGQQPAPKTCQVRD